MMIMWSTPDLRLPTERIEGLNLNFHRAMVATAPWEKLLIRRRSVRNWAGYSAPPDSLAVFRGATSKGRGGEGTGGEGGTSSSALERTKVGAYFRAVGHRHF